MQKQSHFARPILIALNKHRKVTRKTLKSIYAASFRFFKHPKFALNIALLVRHQNFLHPKTGNLQEVSRESVHIYNLEAVIDQNPVLEARTALDKSAQHFGRKKPTVRPEFIPFNIFIHANV